MTSGVAAVPGTLSLDSLTEADGEWPQMHGTTSAQAERYVPEGASSGTFERHGEMV